MNVVMVNDVAQRRAAPQFYSQEAEGSSDNGERLRDANGAEITVKRPVVQKDADGKELTTFVDAPLRGPNVNISEMSDLGVRLFGDKQFIINNDKNAGNPNLATIKTEGELTGSLTALKTEQKLPAIIVVDAAHPMYNQNSTKGGHWHVVSVTDFDEKAGLVTISNQWGKANDKQVKLADLYNTTMQYHPLPAVSGGGTRVATK